MPWSSPEGAHPRGNLLQPAQARKCRQTCMPGTKGAAGIDDGCRASGAGPAPVPERRPRCGWRRRGHAACPAGGRGDVAVGQQQPRPQGREGVEQAGHAGARRGPLSMADCLQGAGRIPLGLPDPRQGGQARGQRLGVAEPPAPRDALGDAVQGRYRARLAGRPPPPCPRTRCQCAQGRLARRRGDLECLPVGGERRLQPALGALDWPRKWQLEAARPRSPAARHPATLAAKPRSASASRPRSHSATARGHRVSAASSGASAASRSPPTSAIHICARHSRGRHRSSSAGSAASHR